MRRHSNQRGAALIMLIGMTAALAILASTLVFVIANEGKATEITRSRTQSFYGGEAALDSAIQMTKVASPIPTASTTTPWLTQTDLAAAFNNEFPPGSDPKYLVYDNVSNIDFSNPVPGVGCTLVLWDSNADRRMWVDATCTAPDGRKSRERVLVQQVTLPFAAALPKAVTYSDTGILLNGHSDIYAVQANGSAITDGSMPTYISAGGTWTTAMPPTPSDRRDWREVGRFNINSSTANLAYPGQSAQSLGIKANGSVRIPTPSVTATSAPNHKIPDTSSPKYTNVFIGPGTVGFLSDYFDQAAQASLVDEAQEGAAIATANPAPTAPSAWTYDGTWTAITGSATSGTLKTIQNGAYTATTDLYQTTSIASGNMTLSTSTARTYSFKKLYVAGNLTISGPITFSATSLYVGGTLTITGTTSANASTAITTDLYVNGTGTSSVTDRVTLSAATLYCGGTFTIDNDSTSTAVTDTIPQIYAVTDFLVGAGSNSDGVVNLDQKASTTTGAYLYAGGDITLEAPSGGTPTDTLGMVYAGSTKAATRTDATNKLLFSGNVIVKATKVLAYCHEFTISGATTAVKDWLGGVYVYAKSSSSDSSLNRGTIDWSGTASVTSRDYTQQAVPTSEVAQPKPMWLGRKFTRTGDYDDEYGNIWVPGNSSTSVVFGTSTSASSTVLCPLLCTTEKTEVSGTITFGTRTQPMVYFFVCDNNGIYPMVVDWQDKGTYYGLMVINESTIDFSGDSSDTYPTVEGAVFAGCPYDPSVTTDMSMDDIVLNDYCSIAYNQAVVGAISTSSLKTTTTVTQTVPGSWQQLPVN
jgi:hypothetical protein